MLEPNFVIKKVGYNSLQEVSHMIAFPNTIRIRMQDNMTLTAFTAFHLRSEAQIIYDVGKKSHSGFLDCSNFHFSLFLLFCDFCSYLQMSYAMFQCT